MLTVEAIDERLAALGIERAVLLRDKYLQEHGLTVGAKLKHEDGHSFTVTGVHVTKVDTVGVRHSVEGFVVGIYTEPNKRLTPTDLTLWSKCNAD